MELDVYCNNGTETALHHVVKMRENTITHRLLQAGANPNLVIYAAEKNPENAFGSSINNPGGSSSSSSHYRLGKTSTPIFCPRTIQNFFQFEFTALLKRELATIP